MDSVHEVVVASLARLAERSASGAALG